MESTAIGPGHRARATGMANARIRRRPGLTRDGSTPCPRSSRRCRAVTAFQRHRRAVFASGAPAKALERFAPGNAYRRPGTVRAPAASAAGARRMP
jgi:hypothetical protein